VMVNKLNKDKLRKLAALAEDPAATEGERDNCHRNIGKQTAPHMDELLTPPPDPHISELERLLKESEQRARQAEQHASGLAAQRDRMLAEQAERAAWGAPPQDRPSYTRRTPYSLVHEFVAATGMFPKWLATGCMWRRSHLCLVPTRRRTRARRCAGMG
jgi:hypothetical protein